MPVAEHAVLSVEQYGRHAPYAQVKPFAHWLVVVQSDASGPPPASVQLTEPLLLFVMSHVSFAAHPHCGESPHTLLGAVVTQELVPPELLVDPPELEPPELDPPDEEPPELDVDVPPELLVEVPPELDPPELDPPDDPPELDVPGSGSGSGSGSSPDDVPGFGTLTLGSSGSVGSLVCFVCLPAFGSMSVCPCAHATKANGNTVPRRSVPPKMRPRLLIEPRCLTRRAGGASLREALRRTRDAPVSLEKTPIAGRPPGAPEG